MNEIGIYYAYWARDWDDEPEPYIKRADRLGFDILELNAIPLLDTSKDRRNRIRRTAEEEGIELTFSLGLPREADLGAEEPGIQRKGVQFLLNAVELVDDMDGDSLSGILYGAWGAPFDRDYADKMSYLERSVSNLEEVLRKVGECQIRFNLEVVNRFEHFLLNTCEEALEYLERIDDPRCNILLDTYHMNIEEDDPGQAIKMAGEQLGHFHIGENNRKAPTMGGHLPWQKIFDTLGEIDYDGPIVMEPFVLPDGDIARDVSLWRDLSEGIDLDEEARKSLKFIKDFLA